MSLVSQDKFNELVGSTTHYLEDLIKRVKALEEQVAELHSKPTRSRKETSNDA